MEVRTHGTFGQLGLINSKDDDLCIKCQTTKSQIF